MVGWGDDFMARFSTISLRKLRYFSGAVFIALGLIGCPTVGSAQDAQALQPLLDLLLNLPDGAAGAAGAAGAVGGVDPLDRARGAAAQGVAISALAGLNPPEDLERVTSALLEEPLILVRRFCEGRLGPNEIELLDLVPAFSPLERDYCTRAGEALFQFGYDIFDGPRTPAVLVNGAIPETYRLGIGDELVITFRGQVSQSTSVNVNREGQVILADLDPISAAGRTFGDFRGELEARVEAAFLGTQVFASLGAVRLVSVSVNGEVYAPGVHQLTGLSTIFDAIAEAGGIKKTGSLREIRVERAGTIFWIDIYDLLLNGSLDRDLALYEGDRIVVPVLGPTVAAAGKVLRPGIFELAEGQAHLSVAGVIALAGGAIRPRGARVSHHTFDQAGREVVVEAVDTLAVTTSAGDMVVVNFGENIQVGTARMEGHVRLPGQRAIASAPTVHGLIGGADSLIEGAYLPFAILETTEPITQARRLFAVDLQRILGGQQDYGLRDNDRLVVLSLDDVRFLSSRAVQAVLSEGANLVVAEAEIPRDETIRQLTADLRAANQTIGLLAGGQQFDLRRCRGLNELRTVVQLTQSGRFDNAIQAMREIELNRGSLVGDAAATDVVCPDVFNDIPDLLPFVLEHVTAINGEVRRPGGYPITEDTPIASIVSVAGGITRDADLSRVEITRFAVGIQGDNTLATRSLADLTGQGAAGVTVNPGDAVRFGAVFSDRDNGPILLAGEFIRPGLYDIRRGERLSEVIARAGGLTQQAYPYGAVFTRESVKRAEKAGLLRAAQELNSAAAFAATRQGVSATAISAVREIVADLANSAPVGRLVMEADPTVLQIRPELDVVLQPGDTLFMPKRPNSVLVIGDVLNPGAQQFVAGTNAEQYVGQAGGLRESADQDRMFLVLPNGVAQPLAFSVWNYQSVQVPPGSTIVSPKNPAPLDILAFAADLTTLLGQLAITAASIAVIGN